MIIVNGLIGLQLTVLGFAAIEEGILITIYDLVSSWFICAQYTSGPKIIISFHLV